VGIPGEITEAWERHVLPTLEDYTRIPCLSPAFDARWRDTGAIDEAAHLLERWCAGRPLETLAVRLVELDGRTPAVVAEMAASPGTGDAPPVLIYGHLDKQPPQGTWRDGLGPYLPVRDGDRLYGRGTADDGYSVFAAVTALEWLTVRGAAHPRVVVFIEASEESGSPDLPAHLAALAPSLGSQGPSLVLCLDSGCITYDRLWATTSLRGNLVADVRVDVLTEGVHSGQAGGVAPSSFRILRRLLDRIEDPVTGEITLDSTRVAVPDSHRANAEAVVADLGDVAVAELPTVPGLAFDGIDAVDRLLRRSWGAALALVGIDGVPAAAQAGNVLRPHTTARISLRLPPSADPGAVGDELVRVLTTDPPSGAAVSVDVVGLAAGWVAPEPASWVADAFDAASHTCFGKPAGGAGEGGTIPFLAELGSQFGDAQMVATGVLGPHSNAHGPNEFLHLPMAQAITVAVAELIGAAASRVA
jgi:acetylornithine deacetylase/succinyl-diaminopimelate desuccinylase-like protein